MIDSSTPTTPPISDPPDQSGSTDLPPEPAQPSSSVADKLSSFSDYIDQYPHRLPTGLKSFGILGILVFGTAAGVLLLKQNLDTRKQASEGNKFPQVCTLKDPTKMSNKQIENSTICILNGATYYACNDSYTFSNNLCVINSPNK